MKKELIDLLDKVYLSDVGIDFETLDVNMECVFDILIDALGQYFDKGQESLVESFENGIPFSKEEFIGYILTDFTNFMINDFINALMEREEELNGEE